MAESARRVNPEAKANFVSKIFLGWTFPLIYSGWKKPVVDADLWELRDHETGTVLSAELSKALNEVDKKTGKKRTLLQSFKKLYLKEVVISGILRAMVTALGLANPILLNNLIAYVSEVTSPGPGPKPPISVGIGWAMALLAVPVLYAILENHYFLQITRTGMKVRSAVQGVLYDKSLKMSPSARAGSSLGEIVNLMQMDTQRLDDFARFIHVLWSAPLLFLVTCILLFRFIQWSAVIGVLLTLLTLPLQGKLVAILMRLRRKGVGVADERVKLMNEILQGIKAVKFYGWETPFQSQVEEKRREEIDTFAKGIWASSTLFAIALSTPVLIAVITFSFYAGVFNNSLDPATIFTAFTLLNMLRAPVIMIPTTVSGLIDARLSVQRIEKFLGMDNTEGYVASSSNTTQPSGEPEEPFVSVSNGSFKWGEPGKPLNEPKAKKPGFFSMFKSKKASEEDSESSSGSDSRAGSKTILHNISLKLKSSTLTAVVGRVGSGKSSLVSALLGEMRKIEGDVYLKGSVAYVSQTAWIFNETLRNNIIFGKEFDQDLYNKAIKVSALQQDFDMLPAGDFTAIGEKGINLSGGQKQRVSIARAVYADADIYIFDDPLSALDAHVSQEVFNKCISNSGVLKDRIRLLVTNQVHVLEDCDNVIFLEEGAVRNEGTYSSLVARDAAFRSLVDEKEKEQSEKEKEKKEEDKLVSVKSGGSILSEKQLSIAKEISIDREGSQDMGDSTKKGGSLIQDEERLTGNVNLGLYVRYAIACGGVFVFSLTLLFRIVVTGVGIYNSYWLAFWSDQETAGAAAGRSLGFYIGIYLALGIGYALLLLLSNVAFGILCLQASRTLHAKTLASVLSAPMSWYDTTPIGRILSRFSRDVGSVDTLLPQSFSQMLTVVFQLVGSYILIATILPVFLAAAVPVTFGYFLLQRFFSRTSLEVKRLDNISKSPIYAHFSETLSGLGTLRAYNKQESSMKENRRMIDINTRAYFTFIVTSRWFSLYLELLGALLIFCTALFAVVARGSSTPAELGLSLAYALQVTSILGLTIRSITELEGNMSSVERMEFYGNNIPQEAPAQIDYSGLLEEERPKESWPERGMVSMKDVTLRYRENLDLVLKGVNIDINAGEKVGIIGRTGSGKSTLMVALLRIVELAGGSIEVDGVDISKLGLEHIRKSITVIPQDPVLFSGTIRQNLDPFGVHADAELWDVLEKANLKPFVSEQDEGLDALVSEYGENLSAGQRQLICLSRALLRRSKILILDEASSSLDAETDGMIQTTIREEMKDATILTIAHRLFTLADYDKILVMEQGRAVEMGAPKDLLQDKNSKLNSFVAALGSTGAAQFKDMVMKASKN